MTPPGHDKGTFVDAMAKRLGISTDAVATIGDMENDLPMFARSGVSFAMGNAADDIKKHATHVTDSNERDGFAAAMETVLKLGIRSDPAVRSGGPPYQAGVKDKSRILKVFRAANRLLWAAVHRQARAGVRPPFLP